MRKIYSISSNSLSDGMKLIIQVIQLYTLVKSTTNRLGSTACPNFRSCRWQACYLGKIHTKIARQSRPHLNIPHLISGCSLLHHLASHRFKYFIHLWHSGWRSLLYPTNVSFFLFLTLLLRFVALVACIVILDKFFLKAIIWMIALALVDTILFQERNS